MKVSMKLSKLTENIFSNGISQLQSFQQWYDEQYIVNCNFLRDMLFHSLLEICGFTVPNLSKRYFCDVTKEITRCGVSYCEKCNPFIDMIISKKTYDDICDLHFFENKIEKNKRYNSYHEYMRDYFPNIMPKPYLYTYGV